MHWLVEASPLQFDLALLLAPQPAGEVEGDCFQVIEDALDDFVWHLPRGSRAQPAAPALMAALEPAWRAGLRLPAAAFERLAYLAAAWQRRLAEKLEPLPALDWQHSLLIELEATELAVLQPLLAAPATLEPALATLRREHLNQAFWQERQELPWMQCPPPLEALRRLHVEQGYYARTHEPLQGLLGWGREAAQALLEAEMWTDDACCLGRWLAVAQELVAQQAGPLPLVGAPPPPEQLCWRSWLAWRRWRGSTASGRLPCCWPTAAPIGCRCCGRCTSAMGWRRSAAAGRWRAGWALERRAGLHALECIKI